MAIFLVATTAFAEVRLELTVGRTEISLQEEIPLTVTLRGKRGAGEPNIENIDDFELSPQGTSSRVNIVNGSVSSEVSYNFRLAPQKEGQFNIGPATLEVDGKKVTSQTVTLTVKKAPQGSAKRKEDHYIVTSLGADAAYLKEPIGFTFQFYYRSRVYNPQLKLPDFKGFWKEQIGPQTETREVINGVAWNITTIDYVLYPLSTGQLEIPATVLTAEVMDPRGRQDPFAHDFFFGGGRSSRRIRLRSEPHLLTVRSLPEQGRPANFSGLVGEVSLSARLSQSESKVGDSVTIIVEAQGEANLSDYKLPFPDSTDFKSYEDKAESSVEFRQGKRFETKTFQWALVPLKEGTLELPKFTLDYFDPNSKTYRQVSSNPLSLVVKPGEAQNIAHVGAERSSGKKIEVLGQDLMPIKRSLASLSSDRPGPGLFRGAVILFFLFPVLWVLFWVWIRKRGSHQQRFLIKKKSQAYRNFLAQLNELTGDDSSPETFSHSLRTYLGDKFNVKAGAMTSKDVGTLFAPLLKHETIARIQAFLAACEAAQFGGGRSPLLSLEELRKIGEMVEGRKKS